MTAQSDQHHFDVVLRRLTDGDLHGGIGVLADALSVQGASPHAGPLLRRHPLHSFLLQDPLTERGFTKPRGYAGDAILFDMIYDRRPPVGTHPPGSGLFSITSEMPLAEAVRHRLLQAKEMLECEWRAGKRICALACGHWREVDGLVGRDLSNVVAVDCDALALERIWQLHEGRAALCDVSAQAYLRRAASEGETFDYIYSLDLANRLADPALFSLVQAMRACLSPGGTIMVSALASDRQTAGWMDAVMDWRMIGRGASDLSRIATDLGLCSRVRRDPSGLLAWCEMEELR